MTQLHFVKMIALAAAAALLVALVAPGAEAHPRPTVYCSESGDLCQSTDKVNGVRRLQIRTFAKFFARYRLCVISPYYYNRTCKTFRMHETDSGSWASSIRWRRQFPYSGLGGYTVVWKRLKGNRIGRKLGFHVR